jgi:hypothetical protein
MKPNRKPRASRAGREHDGAYLRMKERSRDKGTWVEIAMVNDGCNVVLWWWKRGNWMTLDLMGEPGMARGFRFRC